MRIGTEDEANPNGQLRGARVIDGLQFANTVSRGGGITATRAG
ncbi:MAG: hypothetical protein ABW021_12660 [Acidimicrobiia bacterium]